MTDLGSILLVLASIGPCVYGNTLCEPGQLWDPKEGSCLPCPPSTFQKVAGLAEFCQPCQWVCIHRDMHLVETCSATGDNTCVCPDGTHFVSKDGQDLTDGLCKEHSKCGRGLGLKKQGSHHSDVTCEPCGKGFFSADDSPTCYPCDRCAHDMEILTPCNTTSDIVCRKTDHVRKNDHDESSIGCIVGATVGCIFFLFVGALAYHVLIKKCRNTLPTSPLGSQTIVVHRQPTTPHQIVIPVRRGAEAYTDCKDVYPERRSSSVRDSTAAQTVIQRGRGAEDDTDCKEVYTERCFYCMRHPTLRNPDLIRDTKFQMISDRLGKDWEEFFRKLFVSTGTCFDVCTTIIQKAKQTGGNILPDVQGAVYNEWVQIMDKMKEKATIHQLVYALRQIDRNDIIEDLACS